MRTLAITGPRTLRRHVDAFLQTAPDSITMLETPSLDQVTARVRQSPPQVIAIFGGDGTLNRYLPLLSRSRIPVLTFPSGSGNDFAIANRILSADDAMRAWHRVLNGSGSIVTADLGSAKFAEQERLFSCCVNIGLDADAAERTNRLPNWLKERNGYLLGGLLAVLLYEPVRLSLSGDGIAPISDHGWFVAVSNTPTYGGGLKIAPHASICDGCLDVTYLQPTSRATVLRHFPRITSGTHVQLAVITTFSASKLRVDTESPLPVYADGEFFGHTPVEISVIPSSIRAISL